MSSQPTEAPPVPAAERAHGVSLEQYAGIAVALVEGLPLDAILANERLPPEAWPLAERAWKVRVAKEGAGGPLFVELSRKRAVAEDTLSRGVLPIDADLAAWMSFLAAYGAHAAPFELLKGMGIGLNDLSRLQRRWSRRMAEDPDLPRRAAALAKKGPGPAPPLRVEPAVLRPFPWSPGAAPPPAPVVPKVEVPQETSMAPGKVRLYSYVIVKAQLAENPGDEARVLARLGMVDFATTDAGWQVILKGDPDLARDYRGLLQAQRERIRQAAKRPPAPSPEPSSLPDPPEAAPQGIRPPPAKLAGTSLAVDVPRKAALPFVQGAAAPVPTTSPEAPKPAPGAHLAGTSLSLDIPRRASLPFAASAPPPAPPVPPPLSLEQHASLCCELTEAPDRAAETLARYHVTPAAKQAADQHFAARFAADPGARAAWDRAYQTYRTWWLSQRPTR